MSRRSDPDLLQFAALAVWIGAAGFFSAAVAPALFAVLPSRTMAGDVVGRLLPEILYSGMIVGVWVAVTQYRERGAWNWRGRETAGVVMLGACVVAQLIIGPRIARMRAEIGGPVELLSTDDARRIAFGRLHGVSVAWLGLAMLAAAAALVGAARTLNSSEGS